MGSSVDDVETEVLFDKIRAGILVRVQATIPGGGKDIGGTSFVRVTPIWFGPWVAKRDRVAHRPLAMARLALGVHYGRPAAAARWLHDGFEPSSNLAADDEDHTWIEFHLGNSSLMVFKRSGELSRGHL